MKFKETNIKIKMTLTIMLVKNNVYWSKTGITKKTIDVANTICLY